MASSSSSEAKHEAESKFYDREDKKRFVNYFIKPPAKRGRPKKKKVVGRPRKAVVKKKESQTMMGVSVDDLTPKQQANLDARLEEACKQSKASKQSKLNKQQRTKWDLPDNAKLRQRIASSWTETFNKFCQRVGIKRNVLNRFLERNPNKTRKKRGRPTLLSESVMRHLCEGNVCSC